MATAESLAHKLEAVMAGTLSLENVLADPANFEGPEGASFYGLQHFLADADIRTIDDAYRAMQEHEMQRLIELLKSGADAKALAKITFLGGAGE